MTLSLGSRSGQMSNFDVSVLWSLRAGNIDSFCWNISQNSLKGLVKIPCEHKCHSKYGSGSRSGHERSPESFFRACSTWFMVFFERRIQNSKPFSNLTPCKSTTGKGQVNPGSKKVKFSNWYFRIKNACFWTSLISGFQNVHFYFCAKSKNAQNHCLKSDVINEYGFGAICLQKNRYINLKFGILDAQVCFPPFCTFKKWKFGILEKVI